VAVDVGKLSQYEDRLKMPRDVPEWIGRDDNEPVPLRVKIRVLLRGDRLCANCRKVIRPGDESICDHIVAIINGGPNREANLQTLCVECNKTKTGNDVAIKAKTYRTIATHYGIRESKYPPLLGSKRSKWKRKMNGQIVPR
jgi:5-methylcytosine-specific restriction enzyme A